MPSLPPRKDSRGGPRPSTIGVHGTEASLGGGASIVRRASAEGFGARLGQRSKKATRRRARLPRVPVRFILSWEDWAIPESGGEGSRRRIARAEGSHRLAVDIGECLVDDVILVDVGDLAKIER